MHTVKAFFLEIAQVGSLNPESVFRNQCYQIYPLSSHSNKVVTHGTSY